MRGLTYKRLRYICYWGTHAVMNNSACEYMFGVRDLILSCRTGMLEVLNFTLVVYCNVESETDESKGR